MSVLANFLVFQAGWFATVLGAANGAPWLGGIDYEEWCASNADGRSG